jgi:hypothetical protein
MNEEKTITVQGWTGRDKQVTKEEFTKLWVGTTIQFKHIDYSQEWTDAVNDFALLVQLQCEKEFDRLYELQRDKEVTSCAQQG